MIGLYLRDYIRKRIGKPWEPAFQKVDEALLKDTALRTGKIALENALSHNGQIHVDADYEKAASAIRGETASAIRNQNPYFINSQKTEHDDFNAKSTVLSMAIVAYTEKLVEECLKQPGTIVHQGILTDIEKYQPSPIIKD